MNLMFRLSCAASAGASARAQLLAAAASRRLAFVHSGIPADQLTETAGPFWVRRFFKTLYGLGEVEGQNLVVERFSAEGDANRFAAIAKAVVGRNPDVIVVNYNPLVNAFKAETTTISMVVIVGDPIRSGLVASLARPGGNITGVSVDTGLEFYGKELEILKEAIPAARKVAFLGSRAVWTGEGPGRVLRDAGQSLGVELFATLNEEVGETQIRAAFADIARQKADAMIVSPEGNLLAVRELIVALANEARLPALYPYRDYVELGGLMAYTPDPGELAERMADDVHRILAGTKPGEIPMTQPTKIDLIINQKAARQMGLTIPPDVLARADEVVE